MSDTEDILDEVEAAMRQIVRAEEYDNPVLSKEEALKRAEERLRLALVALKGDAFRSIKIENGEWMPCA